MKGVNNVAHVYENLLKVQQSGKFYRDLTPEINKFKSRFETNWNFNWAYDAD